MTNFNRRQFLEASCLAAGAWAFAPSSLSAAIAPGVETVASPLITGEEGSAQPDLWALEVRFKPVRMIYVELPESKTGKSSKQLVWYLAYRAVARKASHTPDLPEDSPERPVFVPEFTFVTEDEGAPHTYQDRVLPVAQAAINKRERHNYKNAVEIVGGLPEVTPEGAKTLKSLDGVATWTDVDPNTDFFTVYMSGFSNGYRVETGPDGKEIVLRRTLAQKFWRPSDRFAQNEEEIRLKDEPFWLYR